MFAGVRKVSLTVDGWTSPFQDDFLGITAHWIDDNWIQRELVIGFEPLNGAHTAENLAEALIDVVDRFHLGVKLQSITTDNASNMKKMVRVLENHPRARDWYVFYFIFFWAIFFGRFFFWLFFVFGNPHGRNAE
jgi:hypothetical protein